MPWTLHFLKGEGGLDDWRDRLSREAEETHVRIADHLMPDVAMPEVDVIVQRVAGHTIPELGLVGHAWRPSCVVMTVDPDNANFSASLDAGQFGRMLAHELHHCLHIARVGHPKSLVAALVSEGLADHFDRELHGGNGQIWDHAVPMDRWPDLIRLAEDAFPAKRYNHELWFFGPSTGQISVIPRWAGYTLGYRMVELYLDATPGTRPSRLAGIEANEVARIGWPRLCAEHGLRSSIW